MKLILVAAILTAIFISIKGYDDDKCKRYVVFRNREFFDTSFRIEHRIKGLRELVYSRGHKALFFKYDYYQEDESDSREKHKMGYITVKDKLFHSLNIRNVNAIAADQVNGIVYIGGKNGLYTLDRQFVLRKTNVRHHVTSISVGERGVYYVTLTHKVFILTGRSEVKLNLLEIAKIRHIAVNNQGNILGVSKTGDVLSLNSNGLKSPKLKATNVVVGKNDELYAYSREGLYQLSDTDEFFEVSNLMNLQGVAFVSPDEIYTASGGYIYRLVRIYNNDCNIK